MLKRSHYYYTHKKRILFKHLHTTITCILTCFILYLNIFFIWGKWCTVLYLFLFFVNLLPCVCFLFFLPDILTKRRYIGYIHYCAELVLCKGAGRFFSFFVGSRYFVFLLKKKDFETPPSTRKEMIFILGVFLFYDPFRLRISYGILFVYCRSKLPPEVMCLHSRYVELGYTCFIFGYNCIRF